MNPITARSCMRGAVAVAALCLASNVAWAGFMLTPSSTTVARGGSFTATLSYVGFEELNWALDVTPLSASLPGFTLTGLTPLVNFDSIVIGPSGGLPQPLDARISTMPNGPFGGSNVPVELLRFDLAVAQTMELGLVTLSAEGIYADNDFNEYDYYVSVDLRIVDDGGVPVPEPGTLALLGLGLLGLGLTRRKAA